LGSETWVNADDAWLPCETSSDFAGTPVLMKYDKVTGIATFLGQVYMIDNMSTTSSAWSGILLSLPSGFHFSKVETDFPLNFESHVSSRYQDYVVEGRSIKATIKWPSDSAPTGHPTLVFGHIYFVAPTQASVWQTNTVVPD